MRTGDRDDVAVTQPLVASRRHVVRVATGGTYEDAGMRTAFESMLAEFDPDHLQQEFDRQLAKGLVPAKLRYWDAYRDRQQQVAKDPEAAFRRLFGDEFSRAYENQLRALKAKERPPRAGSSIAPKEPGT